jgi:hypothetical protein
MNRDKQIDEMAKVMCFQADSCTVKSCVQVNCEKTWLAENLYNAGYRKASEVAREIFEEIEKITMHNVTSSHGIWLMSMGEVAFAELKKKYTEGEKEK